MELEQNFLSPLAYPFLDLQRSLVWISDLTPHSEHCLEQLQLQGWHCVLKADLKEAIEDIESLTKASVVIVSLNVLLEDDQRECWDLLKRQVTWCEWIALVDPIAIFCADLQHLIVENFYDFQIEPLDSQRLLTTVGRAYGMACLRGHVSKQLEAHQIEGSGIIGACPAMQKLFADLKKIESVSAPVLVSGESGTGKELVAQTIHRRSRRGAGPFVAVNCAAIPVNLVQSELFGHEKGAFTGAHKRKFGKVEQASGGTLFLDEIGDLPLESQVNLLRFLQEKTIERVGGDTMIASDVRIIAATHVDLDKAVAHGRFREDLYHRLNVIQLYIPALRERHGDIERLAKHFFTRFSEEKNASVRGFSRGAIAAMYAYHWPGNVRELMNKVRQAMVMSEGPWISASDLKLKSNDLATKKCEIAAAKAAAERKAIVDVLESGTSSLTQAARNLGVSRATFYRLLDKYQIVVPDRLGKLPDISDQTEPSNLSSAKRSH